MLKGGRVWCGWRHVEGRKGVVWMEACRGEEGCGVDGGMLKGGRVWCGWRHVEGRKGVVWMEAC